MSRGWATSITRIEHNRVDITGHPIRNLIIKRTLPEVTHLLIEKEFPEEQHLQELQSILFEAAALGLPPIIRLETEHVSTTLAKYLLADSELATHPEEGWNAVCRKVFFCLGRLIRYIASILNNGKPSPHVDPDEPFSHWLYRTFTDSHNIDKARARMLQALVVACIDHGFTPPSTQACVLAASARVPYEVAIAQGVSSISAVHGGASGQAADFYIRFLRKTRDTGEDLSAVLEGLVKETLEQGQRIPGLGHRTHTADPRCEALWHVAEQTAVAGECVQASKLAASIFSRVGGRRLPVNVDGVIGAIVADMGLPPVVATLVFVLGRSAGLSAHYFEEVMSFPPMRWIHFQEVIYKGK